MDYCKIWRNKRKWAEKQRTLWRTVILRKVSDKLYELGLGPFPHHLDQITFSNTQALSEIVRYLQPWWPQPDTVATVKLTQKHGRCFRPSPHPLPLMQTRDTQIWTLCYSFTVLTHYRVSVPSTTDPLLLKSSKLILRPPTCLPTNKECTLFCTGTRTSQEYWLWCCCFFVKFLL